MNLFAVTVIFKTLFFVNSKQWDVNFGRKLIRYLIIALLYPYKAFVSEISVGIFLFY